MSKHPSSPSPSGIQLARDTFSQQALAAFETMPENQQSVVLELISGGMSPGEATDFIYRHGCPPAGAYPGDD